MVHKAAGKVTHTLSGGLRGRALCFTRSRPALLANAGRAEWFREDASASQLPRPEASWRILRWSGLFSTRHFV
jgi:hypothetical protein